MKFTQARRSLGGVTGISDRESGAGGSGAGGQGVPFMRVVPCVNNLFAVVMHPDSAAGESFSTIAVHSEPCRALFQAMYSPSGYM